MNRLSWNEYPVMAALAAGAGVVLFLLLQTLGGAPAGEQPLKRSERTAAVTVLPPTPSQVEAARQERVRRRADERRRERRARLRARRAAAAAAATPVVPDRTPADSPDNYDSQPYGTPQGTTRQQLAPVPEPQAQPDPRPQQKKPQPNQGESFDDAG